MKALQLVAQGQPGKFEFRDLPDPHPPPAMSSSGCAPADSIISISGSKKRACPFQSSCRERPR